MRTRISDRVYETMINGVPGTRQYIYAEDLREVADTLAAQNRAAGRTFEITGDGDTLEFTMTYPQIGRSVTGVIRTAAAGQRLTPEEKAERRERQREYARKWHRKNVGAPRAAERAEREAALHE